MISLQIFAIIVSLCHSDSVCMHDSIACVRKQHEVEIPKFYKDKKTGKVDVWSGFEFIDTPDTILECWKPNNEQGNDK